MNNKYLDPFKSSDLCAKAKSEVKNKIVDAITAEKTA